MTFETEKILSQTGLFWQYPVKTEEIFYEQNKDKVDFCGIPWATIIDKHVDTNYLFKFLLPFFKHKNYYTCCQHIHFKRLVPLMKLLGVKKLYTPHKVIGEDFIYGVELKPCPLYAVNIEDPKRNAFFDKKDFVNYERQYLYSFMGGVQNNYISSIRNDIFNMKHPSNTFIKNTGQWHFNNVVYSNKQNKNKELNIDKKHLYNTEKYNELLLNSRFSLCPSGSGPNSIRFWESLAVGSIPILLADTLELPDGPEWKDAIIRLPEKNLTLLPKILDEITKETEQQMREKCIEIYNKLKNNFSNKKTKTLIHYCCGSYDHGSVGGVARYDHHIKLAFPDRIFIKQKDPILLDYCQSYKDNLIVITDNHLACDVPNNIKTYLVHHGVAETHAEREPDWNEYWKNLCCDGQKQMLYYRDPKTTDIISISQFCTDEFDRIYKNIYRKFNITKILHCSELNECRTINKFNDIPNILGNWIGVNKGQHIVEQLKMQCPNYKFNKLKVSIDKNGIDDFNKRKQDIYLNNDVFLNLSLCEGFSYAALDALLCGLVVISTDVGVFYKDVPEDCFVKVDWKKMNDIEYIKNKIKYAWENKDVISKNGRNWYMKNCRFDEWKNKMNKLIEL